MSEVVVKVKNLKFGYGKNDILKDISLEINEGEYVGIIGGNGSGKSTLLKLLIGVMQPNSGTISISKKNIGYLSQQVRNFNTEFPATVEEVIAANLYSKMGFLKILNKNHKKKIDEVLKIVNMQGYKDKLIGKLSGGQQQRVFIAKLLVNEPDIIFMDEPIVGLDDESIKSFYSLMNKLNKELRLTIVMITHDVRGVEKSLDKIFCIEDGKIQNKKLKIRAQVQVQI
ncbi:zinc ABC transporter ATP-binding protein ZurA [Gottschalkia acidurici 9a]|uniref:Zinc ABC transporter ATP-binding protein ZurA n=1 Tax=Gottschalkia acidurici (strain ATCC 7906 / DSM 604 / BCRC 14475 / CIP 104303 / KCTC 5404 / NCIMB 10678 / 9a) TaxID=1128398 RepID=K0AXR2_GOTA9|nr:metal ABC transporter ATP-binding protein [Gottschalkia acidurici]AFS77964.1 zinc ABC transporter ATP-binding protein ZurA [Gottschalkia acidurici 9a]